MNEIRHMNEAKVVAINTNEVELLFTRAIENVRSDMRDNTYINEAVRVLAVGGYRSSIGSFWNAVVDDLRNKIMFRSLEMFNKEMTLRREIKSYEDFQNYVNDDELIEGAYKIGVIGYEASKILKHAKETRHFFSGHPGSSEPSMIKVLSVMEDCIKYVLNDEYPSKIIDIDDYLEIMNTESYDRNEIAIENALFDLPKRYKVELSNRIFSSYLLPNASTILKSNIEFCAPLLWKVLAKEDKLQIVRGLDQIITAGQKQKIDAAFDFVEIVNGNEYLSRFSKEYIIKPVLDEYVENLGTFSKENECARKLLQYSSFIPQEILETYVKVITKSFIGFIGSSYYHARTDFYADGAALIIPDMFKKFDDTASEHFVHYIKSDRSIQRLIRTPSKLRRLRTLGEILLERISSNFENKELLLLLADEDKEGEFLESLNR
ncbi:hypothetical protein [Sporosarcina sp. FSL K6-3508]|uniref:hypothetical protein n=1 Tax=Sporosarcina sp. FSL K6-3508 TaxID=2921557 RepID=UPI00315ADAF1